MSEEQVQNDVFPADGRHMLLAMALMSWIWLKWVKGAFFEDQAVYVTYLITPGLIGLGACLLGAILKKVAARKDKMAALVWNIGLGIQVLAILGFAYVKLVVLSDAA